MMIDLDRVWPVKGRALVALEPKGEEITAAGLVVIEHNDGKHYNPSRDFEIGTVLELGLPWSDWEPLQAGDRVIVRAESGGEAGADLGPALGRGRGEVIVVEPKEIVCIVEE